MRLPTAIAKTKLNQLKELSWMEQNFNLVLSGPSGMGKSFIAAGLCYQAIKSGYRAYFREWISS
jgi:DNA replication protein DnaC